MRAFRLAFVFVLLSMVAAAPMSAATARPFKGSWSGETISADPSGFPVVSIVAEGGGHLTHLGAYTMFSPHTTDVFTGETLGEQIFTAANGDTLRAYCAGFATPDAENIVRGTLNCEITGGTGRFAAATGLYTFSIVASPLPDRPGYATEAKITGEILY